MKKTSSLTINRVLLILFSISIPVLLNGVHTWMSAQEDEVLLEDVYKRQIETALFTSNQEINKLIYYYAERFDEASSRSENGSLVALYKLDSEAQLVLKNGFDQSSESIKNLQERVDNLSKNERPIQVVFSTKTEIYFLLKSEGCVLKMRLVEFIKNDVVPLLSLYLTQAVRFELKDNTNNQVVYAQGLIDSSLRFVEKSVWLLPSLTLRAQVNNESIEELRSSRQIRGTSVTILIGLILLGSVVAFFRIWKKEHKISQLKTDFVANVSHELKTPIALIRMNAETLSMGRITDEIKKKHYLEVIEQESERLTHLINNVLNFSKLETEKKSFQIEPISINVRIEQIIHRYESYVHQKGFQIEVKLDESISKINADGNDLDEILINLLDNAIKYSSDKKVIEISTRQQTNKVVFEMKDFGIGISKEDKNYVFEPFFRGGDSLTQQTKGTGLGLSLVKEMLDGIDASIRVDSEIGKGSTFTIEFVSV